MIIVSHTSVGDFCGYLEQVVIPDVSVSFRHLVCVSQLSRGDFWWSNGWGEKACDGAIGTLPSCGRLKIASRPDSKEGALVHDPGYCLDGSCRRKTL